MNHIIIEHIERYGAKLEIIPMNTSVSYKAILFHRHGEATIGIGSTVEEALSNLAIKLLTK